MVRRWPWINKALSTISKRWDGKSAYIHNYDEGRTKLCKNILGIVDWELSDTDWRASLLASELCVLCIVIYGS